MNIQTLKGFRDFLPLEARKRQYVINALKKVFESYGFEPLETPVLEYDEILTGKYGEEGEKLMYRFIDNGERKVAMRYDQTVPLARIIAQYKNQLPMPFKRYQISNVWRAENTQKGRYREFIQCDIDTIGAKSTLSDVEIIQTVTNAYKALGFKNIKILLNDRSIFGNLTPNIISVIDKLEKIGKEKVCEELVNKNLVKDINTAKETLNTILTKKPTENLKAIFKMLDDLKINNFEFSPTLARGLDYYTGIIIEVKCEDYPYGSLGGGGRYDNLIGMFTKTNLPAVGFAIGFDRTIEAMDTLNLFPKSVLQTTQTLVTIFSEELQNKSIEITSILRENGVNTEIYLDPKIKLEKQLKYADTKGIAYAIIFGPDEKLKNTLILKDLKNRTQKNYSIKALLDFFKRK